MVFYKYHDRGASVFPLLPTCHLPNFIWHSFEFLVGLMFRPDFWVSLGKLSPVENYLSMPRQFS